MAPTPLIVSITCPKALSVRNMVLKPYRYPATTRARLLATDEEKAHVIILRIKVTK